MSQRREYRVPSEDSGQSIDASSQELEIRLDLALLQLEDERSRIASLKQELQALRGSRTYRAGSLIQRVGLLIAPPGSWRRRMLARTGRFGLGLFRKMRFALAPRKIHPSELAVPNSTNPIVSIVIPVHGKWSYTAQCLASIAANTDGVELEVIIVDDVSPDDSVANAEAIEGLRLLALERNVGFTVAANRGMEIARGDYILLLNNDTEVTAGWLGALLETAAEENVGIVGSKLIYPDGRLQEAGGCIFSDGSGWNYGRFDDPSLPQYNHKREVDYCSGASILISRELYEATGGFDERYAPAYYEDTDLAFEARRLGYRVMFEPRSVVVHHEGISHGRDETRGLKAFQEVNRAKFVQKWSEVLRSDHLDPSLAGIGLGSLRSSKGAVVVIDHLVPRWHEDSGSVRMRHLLIALVEIGYDVIFVADNREHVEPYVSELQRAGVLVWTGNGDVWEYIQAVRPKLVCGIISRVSIALDNFMRFKKIAGDVPVIFDTVDLHFLREERRASVEGAGGDNSHLRVLRELELAFVRAADATLVVSEIERKVLEEVTPHARVVVVSNVHAVGERAELEGRSEISFVGNFQHDPNQDAVRWFVQEIFPRVRQMLPSAVFNVVGKNPPQDVVQSASESVRFSGWVEDLDEVHSKTRVSVAPLRYGAGVKGKVGDAWAHGIPVVMTSVAAEGMSVVHGVNGFVTDDPERFAEYIHQLYIDDSLWLQISRDAQEHVDRVLGEQVFRESLGSLLVTVHRKNDGS